mgnify:CR=1 FL=1
MLVRHLWMIAAFILGLGCSALTAQEARQLGTTLSAVVVVDTDQLYRRTKLGQRIAAELREQGMSLQRENDGIEQALTEEEQSLTERREAMKPDDFRAAAKEFDARVQGIRRTRDAAITAFNERQKNAPNRFLEQVRNILGEIMVERGAVALLNQQIVLLSLNAVDITDQAVARIDERLGDGTPAVASPDSE